MQNITKSRSFKWSVITAIIMIIAYMFTWRFYAMWWFFIVFIDLGVFLIYSIVSLGSIIFWIRNRKKFEHPFIPLCINTMVAMIIIYGPSIYGNKSYPKQTIDLYNYQGDKCACHLQIETYCVYGGGALGSDINSLYLTDSVNFRLYLGTYDEENGMITTKCYGDNVFVEKTQKMDQIFKLDTSIVKGQINIVPHLNYKFKTTYKKTYHLSDLKKQHTFD